MSYFTWVSLTLENATVFQARDIEKRLTALGAIGREFTTRHGLHFDACCEIDGWHPTCEPRFMRKVSREFSDVLFVIRGEGEVINGMRSPFWEQYYLNGKCYLKKITASFHLFLRHICGVLSRTSKKTAQRRDRNHIMASRVCKKLDNDPVIPRPVTTARYPNYGSASVAYIIKEEKAK